MEGKKLEYPAKLVGYRIDVVHDCIVLFEDTPTLWTDAELERRLRTYRTLEEAGAIPYTFELVSLQDLEATMADVRADLERQLQQMKDWWQRRQKREPEPVPDRWAQAVLDAAQLAQAHFVEQGNKQVLKRLPRAQAIAEGQNWHRLGDKLDTWLIPSSSQSGVVYMVNGRCSCQDRAKWCKHRLARALAKRAAEILRKENGADGASNTPAPATPEGSQEDLHSTTAPTNGQAQRIDVIVAYQADEAKVLPRTNGNGQLISFMVDGQEATSPAPTMPELYRWLQNHGYVPGDFKWLGWEHGLRQRRQSYTRSVVGDRDTALPVQPSRGRSKLFKEK